MIAIFLGATNLLALPFNGIFDVSLLLMGVSGLAIGIITQERSLNSVVVSRVLLVFVAVFTLGTMMNVGDYYFGTEQSGGYYPWVITAPFVLAVFFLATQFRTWLSPS